jgi:hypothetical protein
MDQSGEPTEKGACARPTEPHTRQREPDRPRAPMTPRDSAIFTVHLVIFDKAPSIFRFWQVILLHHCYSAQSILLQCSAILVNSVIPHCYSIQTFSTKLKCSAIHSATMLSHFPPIYNVESF